MARGGLGWLGRSGRGIRTTLWAWRMGVLFFWPDRAASAPGGFPSCGGCRGGRWAQVCSGAHTASGRRCPGVWVGPCTVNRSQGGVEVGVTHRRCSLSPDSARGTGITTPWPCWGSITQRHSTPGRAGLLNVPPAGSQLLPVGREQPQPLPCPPALGGAHTRWVQFVCTERVTGVGPSLSWAPGEPAARARKPSWEALRLGKRAGSQRRQGDAPGDRQGAQRAHSGRAFPADGCSARTRGPSLQEEGNPSWAVPGHLGATEKDKPAKDDSARRAGESKRGGEERLTRKRPHGAGKILQERTGGFLGSLAAGGGGDTYPLLKTQTRGGISDGRKTEKGPAEADLVVRSQAEHERREGLMRT